MFTVNSKNANNLNAFEKYRDTDQIYWTGYVNRMGSMLFSFDKLHVYNLFTDWDKLTEEERNIFRKENPNLLGLIGE